MGKYLIGNPKNETQTREWLAANIDKFEFDIALSQTDYPDYILKWPDGTIMAAEIEYKSSNFILHGHDPSGCDIVLCWKNNKKLPIPILELSTNTFDGFSIGAGLDNLSKALDKEFEIVRSQSEKINQQFCFMVNESSINAFIGVFKRKMEAFINFVAAYELYIKSYKTMMEKFFELVSALHEKKVDNGYLANELMTPNTLYQFLAKMFLAIGKNKKQ